MQPNSISLSNQLILWSFFVTLVALLHPEFYIYGINQYFIYTQQYYYIPIQFFIGTLLHAGLFHLIGNSLIIYFFGNTVETILGSKNFTMFVILSILFNGIIVMTFSGANTIGISGLALSILTYFTLYLRTTGDQQYKTGALLILASILIGFGPEVSLLGHLSGAIFGFVFYYTKKRLK